jgi:hypothetical protein
MPSNTNNINVNGVSNLKVIPDITSIYFSAESEGETAVEARDGNKKIVDALTMELIKLGFYTEDIQTDNFNVYPNYIWNNREREQEGYKATHSIRIELSEERFDDISDVIDAGVDSGVLVSYINFELSEEKQQEYKNQAVLEATEDARTKAEAIANGLDKRLGKIISVSDQSFGYNPWPIFYAERAQASNVDVAESAKSATASIQPGEQEVNARVNIVYEIK